MGGGRTVHSARGRRWWGMGRGGGEGGEGWEGWEKAVSAVIVVLLYLTGGGDGGGGRGDLGQGGAGPGDGYMSALGGTRVDQVKGRGGELGGEPVK